MRVIIAGSRSIVETEYSHFLRLEKLCERFEQEYGAISMIVSGRAKGPDRLGEIYARDRNLQVAKFPAQWDKHGKAAGPIRNGVMGKFADAAIIMWDGESKGSKHMSKVMEELGKPFILDICKPVVYNYVHQPSGIIKVVTPPPSPSLDDPAYD